MALETLSDSSPDKDEAIVSKGNVDIKGVGKLPMQVAVGSDILKNLEDMVAQRSGGFLNPMLEGIKDAVAITSRDPGAAMAARDQEKRLQQESLFGMRNQIAALKQAQQQQQLVKQSLANQMGLGGAGGAGVGTGGAGGAGAIPPNVAAQAKAKYDMGDYAGAQAVIDDWHKQERVNISKETYSPEAQTQKQYNIPGVGLRDLTPREYRIYTQTGQLPDGSKVSPQVVQQTSPVSGGSAKDIIGKTEGGGAGYDAIFGYSQPGGDPAINKIYGKPLSQLSIGQVLSEATPRQKASNTGAVGKYQFLPSTLEGLLKDAGLSKNDTFSPENQDKLYEALKSKNSNALQASGVPVNDATLHLAHAVGADNVAKLMDPKNQNLLAADVVGLTDEKSRKTNPQLMVPAGQYVRSISSNYDVTPAATTPATKSAEGFVPPPIKPGEAISQYNIRVEEARKDWDVGRKIKEKEGESAATKYGEAYADVPKQKEVAGNTITAADRVIKLAEDPTYKKLMGYFEGGNKAATVLAKGLNWATFKQFGQEEFENALAALAFTDKEKEKLRNLRTDAAQLGIEYTANMFKGARLGIGLEKLGFTGKGVSLEYPAATNKLYAQITKDNAQFVLDAHRKFRDEWKPNHPGQSWGDYIQSKEYDSMLDKHIETVNSRYPGADAKKLGVDAATTTSGASKFDKFRKKAD